MTPITGAAAAGQPGWRAAARVFFFTKHFFLIFSRHVIIKPNKPPTPPQASCSRTLSYISKYIFFRDANVTRSHA